MQCSLSVYFTYLNTKPHKCLGHGFSAFFIDQYYSTTFSPESTRIKCLLKLPQFVNVKEHCLISIECLGAREQQVKNPWSRSYLFVRVMYKFVSVFFNTGPEIQNEKTAFDTGV
jgi:hypothetical protein